MSRNEESGALILQGTVVAGEADAREATIQQLERELGRLRDALDDAKAETSRAQRDAARALGRLRQVLSPLHQALKEVFGELDAAGVDDVVSPTASAAAAPPARTTAVWENWKAKLGAGAAKCIDALLLHGEMNTQQLAITTGYHRNTVPQYVSQLHKAGLIQKNGGRFSLKAL